MEISIRQWTDGDFNLEIQFHGLTRKKVALENVSNIMVFFLYLNYLPCFSKCKLI